MHVMTTGQHNVSLLILERQEAITLDVRTNQNYGNTLLLMLIWNKLEDRGRYAECYVLMLCTCRKYVYLKDRTETQCCMSTNVNIYR